MVSKSEWEIAPLIIDPDSNEKLFFTDHEWETIEAAAARIIPTDKDPGASEARVIVFIDRYLSGIDYHYAASDGSGFLRMSGRDASAARASNEIFKAMYRDGVRELDRISTEFGSINFKDATPVTQDIILEKISGNLKPTRIRFDVREVYYSRLQGNTDQDKSFFDTLCLHVRQGFYSDPVYGGNKNQIGWKVIGFPGPKSLKDTIDGTYTTDPYFVHDVAWEDLLLDFKGVAVCKVTCQLEGGACCGKLEVES